MNPAFLQGDDPEADLMGRAAAAAAPAAPPAASVPARPASTTAPAPARPRSRPRSTEPTPRPAPTPRQRPEKRWHRVNVYLEPKTQGRWLNRTRGRLLDQDRGDIGVTEIVRLALDRLAEQVNIPELVADYDRRYGAQEDT